MVMRRDDFASLPGDTIRGRSLLDGGPGGDNTYPSGNGNAALIAAINSLGGKMDSLAAQIAALGGGSVSPLPGCIPANGQAVQFETINLTEAHGALEIKLTGCATYCHAWCDGNMEGITVRMRDQSAIPVELGRVNGFPVLPDETRVWIKNDVRPGRSILVLCFGAGASMTTVDMRAELNELAARLGSLVSFDRRGRYVWGDNFAGTALRWATTVVGESAVDLTSVLPYDGDQCAHVRTGAVADDYCCIHRMMHLPLDKNIGFQCAFRLDASWDDAVMYFIIRLYNGTNMLDSWLRVKRAGGTWTAGYYNSAAAFVDVVTTWEPRLSETWHRMKLVIDGTNGRYVRAMLDDQVVDLSNLAMYSSADTTQGLDVHIETRTNANAARESWIDGVVITDCEPVDILH